MKTTLLSLLAVAVAQAGEPASPTPVGDGNSLVEVPAAPEKGFHHSYVLFVPRPVDGTAPPWLLVEPNNTGRPNDDIEVHRAAAVRLARDSSVGNFVSVRLGIPLLVPVFPRPSTLDNVYTHALDRDAILIDDGPLKRLDLQLLAMIADARKRLAEDGRPVNEKVLLNGFSASAKFVSRFTFLHPKSVAATACGGVNGFVMVPVAQVASDRLEFPLGTADLEKITGHAFDATAYRSVPQFAYMGEKDQNDAVLYDDAYSEAERMLVFRHFGRTMMPDRWNAVEALYRKEDFPVRFKTFEGIPHGTNRAVNTEVAEFFRSVIDQPR